MKKLICILLSACLLALPLSASVLADNLAADPPAEETGYQPGSVPAESALTDGIRLPLTGLALVMLEHNLTYDSNHDYFVWLTLYYVLSLCGHEDDRAQLTADTLVVPGECVQDFFSALFASRQELPPIPAELSTQIHRTHDDQYRLAVGDAALTETNLTAPTPVRDKLFAIQGTLTTPDDGVVLCSFCAILEENDTMFGFSIVDFVFA